MTETLPFTATQAVQPHAKRVTPPSARETAQKLEATFLAEMLKSAGFGKNANFSGGIGEEQFASFQRQALADEMVKAGGLGLADAFYQSMMEASYDK
ncbi:hypothetical protein FGD77_09105 [Roseovarius sp. M141]|nr:rod-binding protein [Roseovarius sp. M141]MCQ0091843.1 hypothetical protein [Roseovarius sp. M141]